MIAHLEAMKAAAVALGYEVHIVHAVNPTSTSYVVLAAPGWESPEQVPVCGADGSLDAMVRVKAVSGTPSGVYKMLAKLRGLYSPGKRWAPLTIEGRSAATKFVRSEFVGVDDSTTITGTDRNPAQGVDSYRLVSQPV